MLPLLLMLCSDELWIPTHMIHDAEVDDQLAWLLLQHVHNVMPGGNAAVRSVTGQATTFQARPAAC